MGILATHSLRWTLQHSVSDNASAASEVTTTTTVVSARSWSRTARRWLTAVLGAGSILGATSHDAAAFPANACLVERGGDVCTANDGSIGTVELNGGSNLPGGVNPSSCTLGSTITVDLLITLSPIQAVNRFNIGLYVAQDGKSLLDAPPAGAGTCSVFTTPVPAGPPPSNGSFPPPFSGTFSNLDGNACGDLDKDFGPWVVPTGPIQVDCIAGAGGNLGVFVGLSYRQSPLGTCDIPATDVQPGTSSKCNTTSFTIPIEVVPPTGTVTVVKEIIGFNDPGLFNLLVNGSAVASNVGHGGAGTSGIISPGTPVTVTETAGTGTSLGNYTSSLACDNGTNGQFMMPPQGGVICTFTNTRVTNSLTLTKSWVNSTPGDTTTLVIGLGEGGDQVTNGPVFGNSTAPSTTTNAVATVSVGSTVNLSEILGLGNFGSYTASLACAANGSPLTVTNNTITMPNAAVTCTFTNTGVTNAVTVVKELVGFGDLGLFNLLVNGDVVAPNVGNGGQGTSGSIIPGTPVTVTETAGTGTSLGNYTSSLACQSGGQTITVINGQFTMPAAAVTCTFTNTRVTNSVTLTKSWVNSTAGDTTTLVIFGDQVTNAVQGNSTAPSTTTNATATASVGSTVNLAETLGGGNVGVYTASLACTANGNPVPVTQIVGSGSITMPNAAVTCTFTDTAGTVTTNSVTLTKSWVNSTAGDTATLTISGAQVSGAVGGSSTAPSTTTNATATASPGSTVNLAETLGGGNVGSYTASLACTANGSPLTVTNNTITMPNAAVTCTFTNTAAIVPPTISVPTLSEWAMLALVLVLITIGYARLRRQQAL
jgi:hypothetical protein